MVPRPVAAALSGAALAAALLAASPTAQAERAVPRQAGSNGICSADARLLGFSDALDKTTYGGSDVVGLSALALDPGGRRGRALVDNQGSTPARIFDLALGNDRNPRPRVTGLTELQRPTGRPYTGEDFDGEGLVSLPGGGVLASSELEPSIRRFSARGRQMAELPVPARFRPSTSGGGGEATGNATLEGLGLSPDGRTLWAGMEGELSGDATPTVTTDGARVRFLQYRRSNLSGYEGSAGFAPARQVGYQADPGLGVSELQVVSGDELLVLERGFDREVGNTVRVYEASLAGASDVTDTASLTDSSVRLVGKRLLVDLGSCPPSGAQAKPGATQANSLLDNVEGMALSQDESPAGERTLTLLSDDNLSPAQTTRLYRLAVRLRGEPTLEARALYPATQYQPGPVSGTVGVTGANGVTPPFPGQPVPGFSAALPDGPGRFLAMPDNGFGAKGNSADFLLRVYRAVPRFKTAAGGDGVVDLPSFISLRDPDRKVPFPITNGETPERLLTGADFDVESFQRGRDGSLWFGDEFGPYLLHTDAEGEVLDAPVALPGVKSPQSNDLAPGEVPNLPGSGGFEATAANAAGTRLYPILERALVGDDPAVRRVYELDTRSQRYTGRQWKIRLSEATNFVGDAQVIRGGRIVLIERDNFGGPAAKVKRLVAFDLDDRAGADGTQPTSVVADMLRIRDPRGISLPAPAGAFGVGDPFAFPFVSFETVLPLGGDRVLIANDNNFPGDNGRIPGKPDDIELAVVRVPGLR